MGAGGAANRSTEIIEDERCLKPKGKPNSRTDLYVNGRLKQQRWYGADGKAVHNRDHFHQNAHDNHPFPHDHNWDWNKSHPREREPLPPDYNNFN